MSRILKPILVIFIILIFQPALSEELTGKVIGIPYGGAIPKGRLTEDELLSPKYDL